MPYNVQQLVHDSVVEGRGKGHLVGQHAGSQVEMTMEDRLEGVALARLENALNKEGRQVRILV